jgi:Domain of unknown function (DUF1905)/Bacteriocin-protection, YdeI or OmpD-Associated
MQNTRMSARPFEATIYKIWMLRYVDVPGDLGAKLAQEFSRRRKAAEKDARAKIGSPKHIPVVATVNSTSTRTTLVPAGAGRYRLQFNATLRKAARADVGDVARVRLKLDLASRDLPIPLELEAAMQRNRVVRREFNALPPGLRMQLLRMLNKCRAPQTLHKRIDRTVEIMLARALRKSNKKSRKDSRKKKKPAARKLP